MGVWRLVVGSWSRGRAGVLQIRGWVGGRGGWQLAVHQGNRKSLPKCEMGHMQVSNVRAIILDEVHCMNERSTGDVWERIMLAARCGRGKWGTTSVSGLKTAP